jgi:thiamine phosphate synthase YjbQ (UPF0047 family)
MLYTKKCYINTTEEVDAVAITHDLKYAIADSKSPDGLVTVLVTTPGAGLAILPPIEDAIEELKVSLDVFGADAGTAQDKLKREREIGPIVQSAILGRTVHLPFQEGKLLIDPYDEIYLLDFEHNKGRREFLIHVFSEAPAPCEKEQGGGNPNAG